MRPLWGRYPKGETLFSIDIRLLGSRTNAKRIIGQMKLIPEESHVYRNKRDKTKTTPEGSHVFCILFPTSKISPAMYTSYPYSAPLTRSLKGQNNPT